MLSLLFREQAQGLLALCAQFDNPADPSLVKTTPRQNILPMLLRALTFIETLPPEYLVHDSPPSSFFVNSK